MEQQAKKAGQTLYNIIWSDLILTHLEQAPENI